MITYCVESPVTDQGGQRVGTFRFRTPSKARAIEVAAAAPGRTIREEDDSVLRAQLEQAAREK